VYLVASWRIKIAGVVHKDGTINEPDHQTLIMKSEFDDIGGAGNPQGLLLRFEGNERLGFGLS
jgi:hypothetical protein